MFMINSDVWSFQVIIIVAQIQHWVECIFDSGILTQVFHLFRFGWKFILTRRKKPFGWNSFYITRLNTVVPQHTVCSTYTLTVNQVIQTPESSINTQSCVHLNLKWPQSTFTLRSKQSNSVNKFSKFENFDQTGYKSSILRQLCVDSKCIWFLLKYI